LELRDPTNSGDNWLCGKQCFRAAERLDAEGHKMKGMSPLIFHSDAPMCQINYSEALEEDGTFGEKAQRAWRLATSEWKQYGTIDIRTTYRDPSSGEIIDIHLNDREAYEKEAEARADELDKLAPGLRAEIHVEKLEKLSDAERKALDTDPQKRTGKQHELAAGAERALEVTHEEVARRVKGPDSRKARKLAEEAKQAEMMATYISRYRQIVNFEYWRLRCEVEQTDEAIAARKAIHQGETLFRDSRLDEAREAFDDGLAKWRLVLNKFPKLVEDQTTGDELVEMIDRYRRLLKARDEKMPEEFILQDVLDRHERPGQ
jgi:hypothetical protein